MSRKRQRAKGRRVTGTYFGLPHAVMDTPNYRALSAPAVKLLNDVGRQYRGFNNGDLCITWRVMQPRGWKSRDTLYRAKTELLRAGMIELTRQGGLHCCNLYALTWQPVDECNGKLDVSATRVASSLWKQPKAQGSNAKRQNANTVTVSPRHGYRVNHGKSETELTRQTC
jgi:hypothetical protein